MTQVLRAFSRALGLEPDKGESIAFLFEEKVPLTGMTTWHMQQHYLGIPVWGERITVTAMKGQKPQRISGHALRSLSEKSFSMTATLTAQQALQRGRKLAGAPRAQTLAGQENPATVSTLQDNRPCRYWPGRADPCAE